MANSVKRKEFNSFEECENFIKTHYNILGYKIKEENNKVIIEYIDD